MRREKKSDRLATEASLKADVKFEFEQLPEAITFKPSMQDFADPLKYIEQIRPLGEKYGICKIVPPKGWKPPFSIDSTNFKFTPRVQHLNELEAVTRAKLNFLDKLSKFWELQGKKFRMPVLEKNFVDLYKLNKLVNAMGGYEYLVQHKQWSKLAKEMALKETCSSHVLKTHYEKLLYPFLLFEAGVSIPVNNKTKKRLSNLSANGTGGGEDELLNADVQESENVEPPTKKRRKKFTYSEAKVESIVCLVCGRGDDEELMLLCDGCDDSYHTQCLYPPLQKIPKGDWRCPVCLAEVCMRQYTF
jgi:[histone H3]-trimethyl-L-lysine4 demethylase